MIKTGLPCLLAQSPSIIFQMTVAPATIHHLFHFPFLGEVTLWGAIRASKNVTNKRASTAKTKPSKNNTCFKIEVIIDYTPRKKNQLVNLL